MDSPLQDGIGNSNYGSYGDGGINSTGVGINARLGAVWSSSMVGGNVSKEERTEH